MMANRVPLWSVTTWDKKYNAVEKEWQPQTIKYKYLLSDELDGICVDGGDVRLLYTGKDSGYTTEDLAGDALAEGEIVAIPWGGTPSVKYFKGKFVTGDNRIATSSKPNELLNKYLYYFLLGNLKEISTYYRGAGLKHPAMRDILNMKISYPDMEKQAQIIAQFDLLQEIIDKRKRQMVELDNLIKARFVELFGTLENPVQKFKRATLKELCTKITDGKHGGCTQEEGTERYFVGAREIYDNIVHYDTAPEINLAEFEKDYKRCNVEIGDFLIVNTGATIGKSAIATDPRTECTLLQKSVALLKVKRELLNPVFLQYCYKVNEKMYKVESASAQPNLLLSKINSTEIYVPPIELQEQFSAFVKQTDKSKGVVQKALDEAQTLFDSLMQEYFR